MFLCINLNLYLLSDDRRECTEQYGSRRQDISLDRFVSILVVLYPSVRCLREDGSIPL